MSADVRWWHLVISYTVAFNFPCGVWNFLIKNCFKGKDHKKNKKGEKNKEIISVQNTQLPWPRLSAAIASPLFSVWLPQVFFAPFKRRKKGSKWVWALLLFPLMHGLFSHHPANWEARFFLLEMHHCHRLRVLLQQRAWPLSAERHSCAWCHHKLQVYHLKTSLGLPSWPVCLQESCGKYSTPSHDSTHSHTFKRPGMLSERSRAEAIFSLAPLRGH